MPYAWNPSKNASNLAKHGIGFEAVQDFDWATSLVQADMRNSLVEVRLIASGVIGTQVHVLVFTIRRDVTGIISLRRANRRPPAMPRKLDLPSPEEDATIQRGIEQDPDSPELGDKFFRDARRASAVLPRDVYADMAAPMQNPPGAAAPGAAAKVRVMLPVDQDVFERLKESGPDWQARVDKALRRLVGR